MDKKRKYAKFLIEGCLKLTKKDKLFIIGSTLIKDFITLVIEEAQKIGINDIETLISDPEKEKELLLNETYENIIKSPYFDISKYNTLAKKGYAFLNLSSPLPNYFNGVDKELLAKVNKFKAESIKIYREYQNKGLVKWNISAVPNEIWANDIEGVNTTDELWELIFKICLINEDDPVLAWTNKIKKLENRANYLTNLKIDKLIYHNSLGTNLEIGLPKNYLFKSAEGTNLVNMPTEEVFTSPDYKRVNGIVYSSKILVYQNSIISDFYLKFKDGKIIDYDAKIGKNILKGIIETDEGSHFLGEVAIVDYNSPISSTNIIFKNTLYDENASCHLAIGMGFNECLVNGLSMNNEELQASGINYSLEHVDFFIGTSDLEIKAVLQNGTTLDIMKKGNFMEV